MPDATRLAYEGKQGKRGRYKENWSTAPLQTTILHALNARNMSIADLARAVGAPGSSVVSRWMQGARPDPQSLEKIARALDLDVFELLYLAEYVSRLPAAMETDDPEKARLIRKVRDMHLTPERAAFLEGLIDTMNKTPVKERQTESDLVGR